MTKILGLDLGTNSIGWAVVNYEDKEFTLLEKGVRIFQEGVKIEKGVESSKAAERTGYRSARRIKYRRKLRKIETLKVLAEYNLCPSLSEEELNNWRYKKTYPNNDDFKGWYLTDISQDPSQRKKQNKNPYSYRSLAVEEKLDLSIQENRYKIGRAIYHICQRRGFLSNRLEGESDGQVTKAIGELSEAMDGKTLGQFFFEKYKRGEKIRNQYTHRTDHYLAEFRRICDFQNLDTVLVTKLYKAIFFQRPLKSQKGLIGKCPFEPAKPRCAASYPAFEEYRMLCFINNMKIKTPADEKLRPLRLEEREKITPQFFRKSKDHFDFQDLAKQLAPKKQYKYFKGKDINPEDTLFNFNMKTTVSGCPVTARLMELFGNSLSDYSKEYIREKDGKTSAITVHDIWHVLFTFDSNEKLAEFAKKRLELDDEQTGKFLKINLKQDYAALSLKAINKILPYLREGLIYSHAVFLANMEETVPQTIWQQQENKELIRTEIISIIKSQNQEKQIIDAVNGIIKNCRNNDETWSTEAENAYQADLNKALEKSFGEKRFADFPEETQREIKTNAFRLLKVQMQKNMDRGEFAQVQTIYERVQNFLSDNFELDKSRLEKLYHPSALDVYKPPKKGDDGRLYLGSPLVSSIRNPMAMRCLHQLRKLINELISKDIIDANTKINIEMARDLMNANERKGIQQWQRERKKERDIFALRIKEMFQEKCGKEFSPTDDDILKYQLWEEQNHICLYTGQSIGICDFLGANPKYDIEHTIPRSISLDNSQENKTLCQNRFNRDIKRNQIPYELTNHEEILERVKHWKEAYEELDKQIEAQVRRARGASTKEEKDKAITRRHYLRYKRDYIRNKYQRFTMKEVTGGFKNSQIVDTGIITKYARLYAKTLFDRVYTVKGKTVANFREMWGLQEAFEKKERVNHTHHCIDAITIACITKDNYEKLAKYYHDGETDTQSKTKTQTNVDLPWPNFVADVKTIENEVLVSHHTPDVLPKQGKKALRVRGIRQRTTDGKIIYQKGDTVRGQLHKETFYGGIKRISHWKDGKPVFEKDKKGADKIHYVVRKKLEDLKKADIDKIVDKNIKEKVKHAIKEGILIITTSDTSANTLNEPIWMNEAKKIQIKKVRCFQPSIAKPLNIKNHRDLSTYNYKQAYHAESGGYYLMALYEGNDKNGKSARRFQFINNRDAGIYFKESTQAILKPQNLDGVNNIVPKVIERNKNKLPLKAFIKKGAMVIFYENSPKEIWDLEQKEIRKRLYKCISFEGDGRIQLRYHQEARPDKELSKSSVMNFEKPEAKLRVTLGNFNVIVENIDFKLSIDGQIERLNTKPENYT